MKTTNPSSRITISQNGNQILTSCKVYKEPNYILSMSNEEILELISGLDYIGNLPTVPEPRETNRDPSLNHPTNTLRTKQRSPNQNQRDNIQ